MVSLPSRKGSGPFAPMLLAYQLYMLTGQTALDDLQNHRHPGVRLEGSANFTARAVPAFVP